MGASEIPVALFAGTVEVTARSGIETGGGRTVKALFKEAVCPPVVTVTVRGPAAASGSIVMVAVAVVEVATVNTPGWPSGAPDTLMPGPKLASVRPCTKPLLAAVSATVNTFPGLPELG